MSAPGPARAAKPIVMWALDSTVALESKRKHTTIIWPFSYIRSDQPFVAPNPKQPHGPPMTLGNMRDLGVETDRVLRNGNDIDLDQCDLPASGQKRTHRRPST